MKQIRTMILVSLLMLSAGLISGCASTSKAYILDQAELVRVKKGQNITAQYDGWLLSDKAVSRIMDTKIKAVNLR